MPILPVNRWYDAIFHRVSRRSFELKNLEPQELNSFREFCQDFKPSSGVRAELSADPADKVFKGAIGNYGKVKGAQAFVAFIGNVKDPNVNEKIGYFGEGIILEATARNLDTCWVGGYFHPDIVVGLLDIRENERVFAVTPIGHALEEFSSEEKRMRGLINAHKRLSLEELFTGMDCDKWPVWVQEGLKAARLSPSAHNNQPWEFNIGAERITISINKKRGKLKQFSRLDCGIALLHFQLGAQSVGINGTFRFLDDPDVAAFDIASST